MDKSEYGFYKTNKELKFFSEFYLNEDDYPIVPT